MSLPKAIHFHQVLGYSNEHRPIDGYFFGPEADRGVDTLFIGVFHGDEGISGELLMRFKEHLTANPLPALQEKAVLIVPVLNPDGLANRTRANVRGVDLNRNFPAENWEFNDPAGKYHSGPAAASEPETCLVINLIENFRPKKIITVHSPYKVLNFDGPARALADAMAVHSGYEVVESIGYPTPGSFGTYTGIERQIPVVTLELPPGVNDPPDPDPDLPSPVTLDEAWEANYKSLEAAIIFDCP